MEYFFFILDFIHNIINNYFYLSLLIYTFFLIIYFTLSLPGGPIFILATGFFFNIYLAFLINLFTLVIGSFLFFISSKTLLKHYFKKKYNIYSDKFTKIIKDSSYEYLILLRFILGLPLIAQNIFISLLNISNKKFIITSTIGFVPIIIILSLIGNQFSDLIKVKNFKLIDILTIDLIFIFLTLLLILIIRIYSRKKF